jgi:hypothetical protein
MTSHHRLSITLHQHKSLLPYALNALPDHVTPLVCLVDNLFFFPLSWRKFILDACRVQAQVSAHYYDLISRYQPLFYDGQDILDRMTVVSSVFSD